MQTCEPKSVGQLIDELHADIENRIDPDGSKFDAACKTMLDAIVDRPDFVGDVAAWMAAAKAAEDAYRLIIPTARLGDEGEDAVQAAIDLQAEHAIKEWDGE